MFGRQPAFANRNFFWRCADTREPTGYERETVRALLCEEHARSCARCAEDHVHGEISEAHRLFRAYLVNLSSSCSQAIRAIPNPDPVSTCLRLRFSITIHDIGLGPVLDVACALDSSMPSLRTFS